MNARLLLACSLLTTLAAAPAVSLAGPEQDGPDGGRCTVAADRDRSPDASSDTWFGTVVGGPATWDRPYTLICTVQVDSAHHNGASNDTVREVAASSEAGPTGVHIALVSNPVNYVAEAHATVYVCTAAAYANGTLYWHAPEDPDGVPGTGDEQPANWTADPNTPCEPVRAIDVDPDDFGVREAVDALACDATRAAAPLVPAIAPDGDVYVADTQVYDCAPYGNDHRTRTQTRAEGRITIVDDGTGPQWTATGELADASHWSCYRDASSPSVGVTCEWVGPLFYPPTCSRFAAMSSALPTVSSSGTTWGAVDTWAICEGDLVAEFVDSGLADQSTPVTFDERAAVAQYLTKVYCTAHGASFGAPQPRYLAECSFVF